MKPSIILRVSGAIADILPIVDVSAELDLVGKPIKDSCGRAIGQIDSVDLNVRKWYGRIVAEDMVEEILETNKKSMSIEKGV